MKSISSSHSSSRRQFFQQASALTVGASAGLAFVESAHAAPHSLKGRLSKTLKIGMVSIKDASLTDRFKAAKAAGFGAIELNCPGNNVDEVKQAIKDADFKVDGSVCAAHWEIRHTDADPKIRAEALKNLEGALRETKAVGGDTVLLVVGHGKDGPEEEIWKRSVENIAKAVPLAEELGVYIAIENVWNHFCYDHEGGPDQDASKFVRYVDEFKSPWVGMQFDIGNHWKYGSMGDWIRALNKRIVKLDVKGFSRADSKFTDIGEGDLDFEDVRKALIEIDFKGWVAAEVGGGDLERLKTISAQMDKEFNLV